MKIFAFDVKKNENACAPWMKCWADLGEIDVRKCTTSKCREKAQADICKACNLGAVLLLVHQQECMASSKDIIAELVSKCASLLIMFVTGGNQNETDNENSPKIHYSKRIVPTGLNLGYLKALLSTLCEALENSNGDADKLKAAWDNWEAPVVAYLLTMISPLNMHRDLSLAEAISAQIGRETTKDQRLLAARELDNTKPEEEALITILQKALTGGGVFVWAEKHGTAFPAMARRYL